VCPPKITAQGKIALLQAALGRVQLEWGNYTLYTVSGYHRLCEGWGVWAGKSVDIEQIKALITLRGVCFCVCLDVSSPA
jgi:hypothetical protein